MKQLDVVVSPPAFLFEFFSSNVGPVTDRQMDRAIRAHRAWAQVGLKSEIKISAKHHPPGWLLVHPVCCSDQLEAIIRLDSTTRLTIFVTNSSMGMTASTKYNWWRLQIKIYSRCHTKKGLTGLPINSSLGMTMTKDFWCVLFSVIELKCFEGHYEAGAVSEICRSFRHFIFYPLQYYAVSP